MDQQAQAPGVERQISGASETPEQKKKAQLIKSQAQRFKSELQSIHRKESEESKSKQTYSSSSITPGTDNQESSSPYI